MPIVVAPFFGFALGAFLAWVATPSIAVHDGPLVTSRPFLFVSALAGLVWLPIVGYFLAFHGDWSYLYFVSWQHVPSAIDLVLVLVASLAVVGGFSSAVPSIRSGRFGALAVLTIAPMGPAIAVVAAFSQRLAISGTYAQFHGDFGTQPLASSPLGSGLIVMGSVLLAAIGWTAMCLLRLDE
jgi:hypothetical protein